MPTYKEQYSNGLPFTNGIKDNVDMAYDRLKRKKASMIILDGGPGEGKTTLATEIIDYLNAKEGVTGECIGGVQFAKGGDDFLSKLPLCYEQGLHVLLYDEAGDFSRRGALTTFNSTLNQVFNVYRAFNIMVILVLPDFNSLDNSIFNNRLPRVLFHLSNRSMLVGNVSIYGLTGMFYLKKYMAKLTVPPQAFKINDPNEWGNFHNLPAARAALLEKWSTGGKLEITQRQTKRMKDKLISDLQVSPLVKGQN
jgi:hypothetical protein